MQNIKNICICNRVLCFISSCRNCFKFYIQEDVFWYLNIIKISFQNIISILSYWNADIVIVAYGCRIHTVTYIDGDLTHLTFVICN